MILASNNSGVISKFSDVDELEAYLSSKAGILINQEGLNWVPVTEAPQAMQDRISMARRLLAAEGALDDGPRRISFANEQLKRRAKIEARKAKAQKKLPETVDPGNINSIPDEFLIENGGKYEENKTEYTSQVIRSEQRTRQQAARQVIAEEVKPAKVKKARVKKPPVDLEELAAEIRDLAANPEGDDWAKELATRTEFPKGAFQVALGEVKSPTKENKLELARRLVLAMNQDLAQDPE